MFKRENNRNRISLPLKRKSRRNKKMTSQKTDKDYLILLKWWKIMNNNKNNLLPLPRG